MAALSFFAFEVIQLSLKTFREMDIFFRFFVFFSLFPSFIFCLKAVKILLTFGEIQNSVAGLKSV